MRIATERLVLREIVYEDWPVFHAYQQDPRYLRYYPWTERTEDDIQSFVRMLEGLQHEEPRRKFQLAITLPGDDTLIGNVGIRRKPENDWEADIGYELNPTYWRRGYATEAARAVVAYGFRDLGVHRISAWCNAENGASERVMQHVGMRLEGRLRDHEFFKDRWWDTLLYAILRPEWDRITAI
jgi:RimJ/RimL family protein N-acetyltransferase